MTENKQEQEEEDNLPATLEERRYLERMAQADPSLFFPEVWSADEIERGLAALGGGPKLKRGSITSIPRKCDPGMCPSGELYCPVLKAGLDPTGYKCPVEMALVEHLFWAYVNELGVDTSQIVEVGMVRDLVDQDIQMIRKSEILADEGFIKANCVGIDASGKPVFREELHMAVELEDRILKRKEAIRKALLATREAQAKFTIRSGGKSINLPGIAGNLQNLSAGETTNLLLLFHNSSSNEEAKRAQEEVQRRIIEGYEELGEVEDDQLEGDLPEGE